MLGRPSLPSPPPSPLAPSLCLQIALGQCNEIDDDCERDYLTDSGVETWNILAARGISNVVLMGVHTNMCVIGRPFAVGSLLSWPRQSKTESFGGCPH